MSYPGAQEGETGRIAFPPPVPNVSVTTLATAAHNARHDELDDAALIAHVSRLLFEGEQLDPRCAACAELIRRLAPPAPLDPPAQTS